MSTLAGSSTNSTATRWNLVISEQTNIAVRSFLALKGFKKGDLSSFVEEAVRWRVFDQTLTEARSGFDDLQVTSSNWPRRHAMTACAGAEWVSNRALMRILVSSTTRMVALRLS